MKVILTLISVNKMHVYIYTKIKRIAKHVYIQKSRHFSKSKAISVTFLYTNIDIIYTTRFI